MEQNQKKSWIFQCQAAKWDVNKYLSSVFKDNQIAYLTTNQHKEEIKDGDHAYIWRAGKDRAIIAYGIIVLKPTPMGEIDGILENIKVKDPYGENKNTLKAGIKLVHLRLTIEEDYYSKTEILEHAVLKRKQVFSGEQGTVFSMSFEEAELLHHKLNKKWPLIKKNIIEPKATGEENEKTDYNFKFKAKPPPSELNPVSRKSIEASSMSHEHRIMQNKLYDYLCKGWGEENVGCEQSIGSKEADVVVKKDSNFDIYEIKTSECPRECIKQAMGQLLDYAYYEPKFRESSSTLWVVGKNEINESIEEYLDQLKEKHNLPIEYHRQEI